MSSISAIRFINLNYNDNKYTIPDSTFSLNEESTLFSMANGTGKTVMIQLIMSIFANCQNHRNLQDRKYIEFFKSKNGRPTSIMCEIMQEDGKTRVLAGVIGQYYKGDNEGEDGLNLYSFVGSYKNANKEFSIKNIPFVEHSDDGMVLKTLNQSVQLLKEFSSKEPLHFSYYSIPSAQKKYIDKLNEYNIDTDTWNDVIYKINSSGESGLSKLFEKDKTSQDIVKNWLIPAICKKKEIDGKCIEDLNNNLCTCYEKKSKLAEQDFQIKNYQKFKEFLTECKKNNDDFKDIAKEEYEQFTKFKEHYLSLEKTLEITIKKTQEISDELNQLRSDQENYEYCKESIKYNSLQNQLDQLKLQEEECNVLKDNLKKNLHAIEEKKLIIDLNSIYNDIKGLDAKIKSDEIKLKEKTNHLFSDEKIKQRRIRCQNIYFLIETKIKGLDEQISKIENDIKDTSLRINELEETESKLVKENEKNNSLSGSLEEKIENYLTKCSKFIAAYNDVDSFLTVVRTVDNDKINNLNNKLLNEFDNSKEQINETKKKIDIIRADIENLNNKRNELKIKNNDVERRLEILNNAKEECEKKISKRLNLLSYYGIENKHLYNDRYLIEECLKERLNDVNNQIFTLKYTVQQRKTEIEGLKNTQLFEIDREISELFDKNNIDVRYGFKLATNSESNHNNELLPYSIVLSSKQDLEKARQLLKDNNVFTNKVISVVLREELENNSLSNTNTLFNFNDKLLEEEGRKAVIDDLTSQNEIDEAHLSQLEEKRSQIEKDIILISSDGLEENSKQKILNNIKTKTEERTENNQTLIQLAIEEKGLKDLQKADEDKLDELNSHLSSLKSELGVLSDLLNYSEKHNDNVKKLDEVNVAIKRNQKSIEYCKIDIKNLTTTSYKLKIQRDEVEGEKKEWQEKLDSYVEYKVDSNFTPEYSLEDLDSLLMTEEQYSKDNSSITELRNRIDSNKKEKSKKQQTLDDKNSERNIPEEKYREIPFSFNSLNELDVEKNKLNDSIDDLSEKLFKLQGRKGSLETNLASKRNEINKEFKKDPLPNDQIQNIDYDEIIIEVKKLISEKENNSQKMETKCRSYKEILDKKSEKVNNYDYIKDYRNENVTDLSDLSSDEIIATFKEIESSLLGIDRKLEKFKDKGTEIYKLYRSDLAENSRNTAENIVDSYKNNVDEASDNLSRANYIEKNLCDKLENVDRMLDKLNNEMSEYNTTFNMLYKDLIEKLIVIDEEIGRIGNSSKISVGNTTKTLIKIEKYVWKDCNQLLENNVREYLTHAIDAAIEIKKDNSSTQTPKDYLSNIFSIQKIYQEALNLDEFRVKVAKVDKNETYQKILWDDVTKTSGSEKFIANFILIAVLMDYASKSDISGSKSGINKVLLMDNPFAETYSEHATRVLEKLSKKLSIQLICFSGIDQENIYNSFNNVYVLSLHNNDYINQSIMVEDHVKGEEYESLIGTQFLVQETSLFDL